MIANKDALLEDYASKLSSYATNVLILETLLDKFNIKLDASPLINFRDAVNHFTILYESREEENFYGNKYAIDEHLSRGIKDIIIYFTIILRNRIEYLSQSFEQMIKATKEKNMLIFCNDKLAEINLEIRSNFGKYDSEEIDKIMHLLSKVISEIEETLELIKIPFAEFRKKRYED